jgi:polyisoprenoid-binding protein YceI
MTMRPCLPADLPGSRAHGVAWRAPALRAGALRIAALAVAIGAAWPACAAPQRYAVDATQSSVDFRIRYLGLFSLGGRFSHVTGVVVIDPDHWETLEVAIEIPADSLETRPEFWRSELLSPRFFDARRYPTIDFRAAGAERTGPATGESTGSLTLHGTTGPVRLRARITVSTGALEVDGETRLARSAFGLGTTLFVASDEVTVTLRIRAAPAPTL